MADRQRTFRLRINVAGPGFQDLIKIESTDLDELEPDYVERQGLEYERYGTAEDYTEIRRDYIVARAVYELPQEGSSPSLPPDHPGAQFDGDHERTEG